MPVYAVVKFMHVLFAIIALGFNLSYIVWLVKGNKQTQYLLFALQGIKLMDTWIANPAYILSALSGLWLSHLGQYKLLQTPWILCSLILFGLMGIIGFGIYAPALSRQVNLLQEQGFQSAAYTKAAKKQTSWGVVLFALALVIVACMVIKPA